MTDTLARFGLRRMVSLNPTSPHRVASPLELLFDLVFVVAVSQASQNLHHLIAEDHILSGVGGYLMVFFAVWWAWMNFTWFASAFDTDDWLYRVLTIIQMGGVLVLAGGIHSAMVDLDFTWAVWGYVVMRVAMASQWLRARAANPEYRTTAGRYAGGIVGVQVLWILWLFFCPDALRVPAFLVLAAIEVLIPIWSEKPRMTAWHPHHIAERYGLFTLLLLGESILASANAIIDAIAEGEHITELFVLAACGLVIVAGIWWVYFAREQQDALSETKSPYVFGYVHYFVFAAAGAVSAGIEIEIDMITGATHLEPAAAGLVLSIPVAIFVIGIWALALRPALGGAANAAVVVVAALIAVAGLVPIPVVWIAALLIIVVAVLEADAVGARSAEASAAS